MQASSKIEHQQRAIDEVLHWLWSTKLQVERLAESTKNEWESMGADRIENKRLCSKTSCYEHLLLVTGRNLLRAIDIAKTYYSKIDLRPETREAIKLLRDIYEHWDEQREAFQNPQVEKTRSGKIFSQCFPLGKPWAIEYSSSGARLAGALEINSFYEELKSLEELVLEIEHTINEDTA